MYRTLSAAALALVCLLGLASAGPRSAAAAPGWAPESPRCRLLGDEALRDPRDPLANLRARSEAGNRLRGVFDGCPHDFDVLHYELNFSEIDFDSLTITGNTVVTIEAKVDGLTSIDLDLKAPLVVSGVEGPGAVPLAFTHVADNLEIQLAAPADSGDTLAIDVAYGGTPWNEGGGGFGGFWFGFPLTAYSMGVGLEADPPSMGRTWFPSYDRPCDKATVGLNVTAPFGYSVVANGLLTGVDSTATDHTFHWAHDFPISTYLIAMSVANYKTVSDTIVTDPRITCYHHPGYKKKAEVSFRNVDLMMESYETRFGPYPFDKFAFMTTMKGDMEHQTCVSHALVLVDSTNNYDDILSHEMTHMWYGDCVTYGDWRDVWLSEGFATYGEAVYREYRDGTAAYHAYMTDGILNRVLNAGIPDGVYDPTEKWGVIAYEKGACVLHMLRGILDDDALFWQLLRDYKTNFEYGNAVTPDFVASASASALQDLSWFLDPWIWGEGIPVWEYGWGAQDLGGGQWQVDVGIRQAQTTASLFDVPLDIRVHTAGGDFDFSERISLADQTVSFVVPSPPTGVTLDPDDWVLDMAQLAPTSAGFGPDVAASQELRLLPPRPNPSSGLAEIRYYVPSAGRVAITVHDVAGRRVRALDDRIEQAGPRTIWWDHRDDSGGRVAAGVYWVRLEAPGGVRSTRIVAVD
jgi:aminopeptidase N